MESFAPLVWVEADRKPAKYFLNSLNIHNELFPSTKKVVITNRAYFDLYKKSRVELIEIESLKTNKYLNAFESTKKNWTSTKNQKRYWLNTTKRFLYLYAYLLDSNLEKLVHLESDCILLNRDAIKMYISNDQNLIYFPKHVDNVGCASILIINSLLAYEKFILFLDKNWKREDVTDMHLLGEFAVQGKYAKFLPSFADYKYVSEYIFDSVSISRFFTGNDARNIRFPFSRRGVEDISINSNTLYYFRLKSDRSLSLLSLENIISDTKLKLVNIHIHSKRIPKEFGKLIKMHVEESNRQRNLFWKIGRLDYVVLTERLISKVFRLFKTKGSFEILKR